MSWMDKRMSWMDKRECHGWIKRECHGWIRENVMDG